MKLDPRKRERLACDLNPEIGKDIAAARKAQRVIEKYRDSGELAGMHAGVAHDALNTLVAMLVDTALKDTGL